AGLLDLFQISSDWIVSIHPLQRETAVAVNRRQQVIEVMHNAARELTDRLHLLRLAQLILELSALSHVASNALYACRSPVLINQLCVRFDRNSAPVLRQDLQFIGSDLF